LTVLNQKQQEQIARLIKDIPEINCTIIVEIDPEKLSNEILKKHGKKNKEKN